MDPTLSVVIPTFNRAAMVSSCVAGVLGMGLPFTEVIVVDDGSTDGTKDALAKFGRTITYVWQENTGPSGARNAGAALSRGRYLAFLDSDDHWLPDGPQALVRALSRHPELPAVFADAQLGNDTDGYRSFVQVFGGDSFGNLLGPEIEPGLVWCHQWPLFHQMLVRNVVFPGSLFWRRETFNQLGGFDTAIPVAEDWELSMRLVADFNVGYFRQGPVTVYHWHQGDRLTSDPAALAEGYILALESLLKKTALSPDEQRRTEHVLSGHYANRAHGEFVGGDLRLARGHYRRWLRRFGFDRRIALRWAFSHAPRAIVEPLRAVRRSMIARIRTGSAIGRPSGPS